MAQKVGPGLSYSCRAARTMQPHGTRPSGPGTDWQGPGKADPKASHFISFHHSRSFGGYEGLPLGCHLSFSPPPPRFFRGPLMPGPLPAPESLHPDSRFPDLRPSGSSCLLDYLSHSPCRSLSALPVSTGIHPRAPSQLFSLCTPTPGFRGPAVLYYILDSSSSS